MNFISKSIYLLSVIFILASCTERIDIKTDDAPEYLVIYGNITTDKKQHAVKLTRSTGYFATGKPGVLSNARVSISTDDETFPMLEDPANPGVYLTDNVSGVEGKTYNLNVSLDFDGDGQPEEYNASSYLPYATRIDTIDLQPSTSFDDMIEVLVYGQLADNEENFISVHVYKNDVLVNDSLVGFTVYDDEFIDNKTVTALPCYFLSQTKELSTVYPGDKVTLRIDALTKEYSKYLEDAQTEIFGSIPLFSGPPANVKGNIKKTDASNNVFVTGFFAAFSGNEKSTIVK